MVQDYPETWFGDLTSNIPVTVTPPCQPDFTLTATNPPAANVGATAITILTISSVNSFSGTVSLTDTVPTGLSCGTINPSTVTSSGGSAVSCSGSYAGAFPVTITGTSGSLTHSVTVNFSSMDFTISSSSPSASVQPNGSGTSTIDRKSVV